MFPHFFSQLAPCAPDAAFIDFRDDEHNLVLLFKKVNKAWIFKTSSLSEMADNIINGNPTSKVTLDDIDPGLSGVPSIAAASWPRYFLEFVTGDHHNASALCSTISNVKLP